MRNIDQPPSPEQEKAAREKQAEVLATQQALEASVAAAAAQFKARSQASNTRLRRGLADHEAKGIVRLLIGGASWELAKQRYSGEIADETLEGWKPELLRRAQHPGGQPRLLGAAGRP